MSGIFEAPDAQTIQQLVNTMRERIDNEDHHIQLGATDFEKQENHLKRFLVKHFMDIEIALTQWHGWVKWRHGNGHLNFIEVKIYFIF